MGDVFQIHTAHKNVSSLTKSIKNIAEKNLAMLLFYWLLEFVPGSILSRDIVELGKNSIGLLQTQTFEEEILIVDWIFFNKAKLI